MNRYLLSCLLALLLPLPTTTAQRGLPPPTHRAALPAPAFSTVLFLPATADAPASRPAAARPETPLAQQALRELRLSWQFIKQQFRYEP